MSEQPSLSSRIAWYALLGAILLVPVTLPTLAPFGIGPSLMADPFSLAKLIVLRVFTLVALASWAFSILTHGGRVRHTPVDWLVLAFVVWVGITTAFSINFPTALVGKYHRDEGFLSFLNYGLIYFLTLQLADRASRVRAMALALFASSIVVAGYGVLQYYGLDPVPWVVDFGAQRAFSTYGNPNIFGGYLMFSLPIALALALAETRQNVRHVFWAGFYLNLFALTFTFTRGAWIGGAAAIALVAFIALRNRILPDRRDVAPAALAGLAGVATALIQRLPGFAAQFPLVEFGVQRLTQADPGGVGARLMLWKAALSAIAARPILGYGPDTFRYVFPRHKPPEYVRLFDNIGDSPHNYPLQLGVGSGVVGFFLFHAIMAWAAIRSAPHVFRRSSDPTRILLGAFWAAAAGYLASLIFGLSLPGVSFLLWMAVAVVLAPTAVTRTVAAPSWGRAAVVGIVLLAVAGIGLQIPLIAADRAFMRSEMPDVGSAGPRYAAQAVRLNPLSHAYREQVGVSHFNEALRQLGSAEEAAAQGQDATRYLEAAERSLANGERALRAAIEWAPDYYANYQYLAALYNLRGDLLGSQSDFLAAIRTAVEARLLDPYAMAIRVEQAYALRALDRTDEAIALLDESLDIVPGHARAALLLAAIHEATGDRDAALRVLRKADAAHPGQPALSDSVKLLETGGSLLAN